MNTIYGVFEIFLIYILCWLFIDRIVIFDINTNGGDLCQVKINMLYQEVISGQFEVQGIRKIPLTTELNKKRLRLLVILLGISAVKFLFTMRKGKSVRKTLTETTPILLRANKFGDVSPLCFVLGN